MKWWPGHKRQFLLNLWPSLSENTGFSFSSRGGFAGNVCTDPCRDRSSLIPGCFPSHSSMSRTSSKIFSIHDGEGLPVILVLQTGSLKHREAKWPTALQLGMWRGRMQTRSVWHDLTQHLITRPCCCSAQGPRFLEADTFRWLKWAHADVSICWASPLNHSTDPSLDWRDQAVTGRCSSFLPFPCLRGASELENPGTTREETNWKVQGGELVPQDSLSCYKE